MKTSIDLVRTWGIIASFGLAASGCAVSSGSPTETPEAAPSESGDSAEGGKVAKKESEVKAEEAPKGPTLLFTLKDVGLEAPEAIIYDPDEDVYLVSNVHGDPLASDGNGFISKVSPDGKVQELKWIDGQKQGVTLNAPKGMAVSQGFLYVSDITWIRVFDRKTGEPKGKIFAKGATFLNGVAKDDNGEILFSDTGWKSGKDGFATTGSDALFRIDPKTVAAKEVARGKDLGNPNGLTVTKDGLWVVNDQGELFLVGKDGKKEKTTKLAKGGLDGVVALDDGRFLVSSWKANAIYEGKPGEKFEVLLPDLKSPASIGYDSKRGRILVPKMLENQALIYDISGKAPAAAPPKKDEKKANKADKADEGKGKADKEAAKGDEKKAAPAAKKPKAEAGTKADEKKAEPAAKPAEKKPAPAAKGEEKKAQPEKGKEEKPAKAATPATPAKPAEPGKPGEPAKSAEPAKPAQPSKK